jgi:hypothetical protein
LREEVRATRRYAREAEPESSVGPHARDKSREICSRARRHRGGFPPRTPHDCPQPGLAEEVEFGQRDLRVRAPDRGRLAQAPHLGRLPRRHGGDPMVAGWVAVEVSGAVPGGLRGRRCGATKCVGVGSLRGECSKVCGFRVRDLGFRVQGLLGLLGLG